MTFQRERFCTALKRSEAHGPRPWPSGSSFVGVFSLLGLRISDLVSERSLNVLRLAVPNISEYPNSCPALVFHATHDNAEKVRLSNSVISIMFLFVHLCRQYR